MRPSTSAAALESAVVAYRERLVTEIVRGECGEVEKATLKKTLMWLDEQLIAVSGLNAKPEDST